MTSRAASRVADSDVEVLGEPGIEREVFSPDEDLGVSPQRRLGPSSSVRIRSPPEDAGSGERDPSLGARSIPGPAEEAPQKAKSWFSSIPNLVRYGVVIVIIAFLGFNVFTFLGGATDSLTGILGPAAAALGKLTGSTVKQGTDTAAKGVGAVAGTASKVVDKGVDLVQTGLDKAADRGRDLAVDKQPAPAKRAGPAKPEAASKPPAPDDTASVMQRGKGTVGKGGFCYIGEDRGVRSCSKVSNAAECQSGQMFSSMAACQDPNLRK